MTGYNTILRTLAATALVLTALTACEKSTKITTTAASHLVTLRVTGPFSIETGTNEATITYDQHRVTIERRRVLFDGALWATTRYGAPESLSLSRNTRSITVN